MNRNFDLAISELDVFKRFNDGVGGGGEDLAICGFGINRNGSRYAIKPVYVPNKSEIETANGFRFNSPIPLFGTDVPFTENDFLFCLWLYERDNESLSAGWNGVVANFERIMDEKLQSIANYSYPDAQFQAFAEIMISMHGVIKVYADSRAFRIGDGDDIAYPFFIRAHHDGRNASPANLDELKRPSYGRGWGKVTEKGGTVNYILTLTYSYGRVDTGVWQ